MKTVYLNASYFPAVELLSAVGTAAILLYGGSQAIDGAIQIGVDRRLRRLPADLLRPDPAALPALHDLPAGDGGARQDLRPARHRAGHGRRARTRSTRATLRGEIELEGVWFSYARRRARRRGIVGAARRRPPRAARARRWRWSAPPAPASRPSRSWSPASTTRSEGTVLVDGHDLRGLQQRALRRQLGIVPQEGFLFSGSVRENVAFGRPEASARGDRGGGRRGRRDRVRRRACPTASRPRSASAASSSRPASASSSPSPAPCWPSRAS